MNLKSLKVFCDVVGRRSFSRAAAENGISQSGASQIVNHLEDELGVKLIDRTKRPFTLTPEGEAYYEGCRKLVQRYFALEEEVKTLHEEVSGRVSVASIYSIGLSHMNRFVQNFLRRYPKANVRLQYQHPRRVYELVESDQVDLGLVSYPRSSRTIKATPWREEPMVLVCSPEHPLAAKDEVRLEDLHGVELVAFDSDLEIRDEIDRALAGRGIEVRVAMEFDNTETIKGAVEINAGVALLPRPTVDREVQSGALKALPLAGGELTRPIGIIQRRGKDLGQTASRFMQLLLQSPATSADDAPSAPLEIAALDETDSSDGPHRAHQAAASPQGAAADHSRGGNDCLPSSITDEFPADRIGAKARVSQVKA